MILNKEFEIVYTIILEELEGSSLSEEARKIYANKIALRLIKELNS